MKKFFNLAVFLIILLLAAGISFGTDYNYTYKLSSPAHGGLILDLDDILGWSGYEETNFDILDNPKNILFQWKPISGSVKYDLYINDCLSNDSQLESVTGLTNNMYLWDMHCYAPNVSGTDAARTYESSSGKYYQYALVRWYVIYKDASNNQIDISEMGYVKLVYEANYVSCNWPQYALDDDPVQTGTKERIWLTENVDFDFVGNPYCCKYKIIFDNDAGLTSPLLTVTETDLSDLGMEDDIEGTISITQSQMQTIAVPGNMVYWGIWGFDDRTEQWFKSETHYFYVQPEY